MLHVIDIQGTPNPDALKFVLDVRVVAQGAKSFDDMKAAQSDPLAQALFGLGPVASVFCMDRFVTVTKFPTTEWDELYPRVRQVIETIGQPIPEVVPLFEGSAGGDTSQAPDDMLNKINQILDENIRPALAGDGGGLEIVDYRDFTLTVHYQGACGSCPSSTTGTLSAIQNLLQRMADPRIQVVSG
jgi:Fe-S cluster biogenesis protein NfuA